MCSRIEALRSGNSKQPGSVTFINNTGGKVQTYWLNYQGKRVHYTDLDPGQSHTQHTFVTNPWVAHQHLGKVLGGLSAEAPGFGDCSGAVARGRNRSARGGVRIHERPPRIGRRIFPRRYCSSLMFAD